MADLIFFIQWIFIITSLIGLFLIGQIIRITRRTKPEILKARVFLNDRILMRSLYLLAIICIMFLIHALSEYISIYRIELFGFTLIKLIKESTELGVLFSAVLMSWLWYSLFSGVKQ